MQSRLCSRSFACFLLAAIAITGCGPGSSPSNEPNEPDALKIVSPSGNGVVLPDAVVGLAWSFAFEAKGGTKPYVWSAATTARVPSLRRAGHHRHRSHRILGGRNAVVEGVAPSRHPLPQVPDHVAGPVGAVPVRRRPHGLHRVPAVREVCAIAIRLLVPPGVNPPVSSPRRLLPLRFRREPLSCPRAIGGCIRPAHVRHRTASFGVATTGSATRQFCARRTVVPPAPTSGATPSASAAPGRSPDASGRCLFPRVAARSHALDGAWLFAGEGERDSWRNLLLFFSWRIRLPPETEHSA